MPPAYTEYESPAKKAMVTMTQNTQKKAFRKKRIRAIPFHLNVMRMPTRPIKTASNRADRPNHL